MANVIYDTGVEGELWEIWQFIAQGNVPAANKTIEAVFATCAELAANPAIGRKRTFQDPRLRGTRSWPVSGYDNYLIFYRQIKGGIQVLHVYHGARDIEALLEP